MNVNNNKLQELSLYTNMSLNNINKDSNLSVKNHKNNDDSSTSISRIKRKVRIMNYQQRELQGRISDIQVQEAKIYEMEKTLENAKYSYSENLKNQKKESLNIRVRIKQLDTKEDELETKFNKEISDKSINSKYEDEKVICTIEETLRLIEKIKTQLSLYKSKLIDLESIANKAVSKLEYDKDLIDKDFIKEDLGFISIEGNDKTGIIINIAV